MRWKQVVVVLGCAGMFGCGSDAPNASVGSIVTHQEALSARADPIGLSLFFSNGQMAPVHLIGSAPRFLQEMDIVESVPSAMDSGIQPLIDGGTASSLNWHGVSQVEEIWVPGLDGTFTRERYYREAKWMEVPSTFTVVPVDAHGHAVGPQLIAHAGSDD
jgi:hypothetical protein